MLFVILHMLLLILKHHQIFRSVVVLISVNMVDNFPFSQWSAEHLFSDYSVLVPPEILRICVLAAWPF